MATNDARNQPAAERMSEELPIDISSEFVASLPETTEELERLLEDYDWTENQYNYICNLIGQNRRRPSYNTQENQSNREDSQPYQHSTHNTPQPTPPSQPTQAHNVHFADSAGYPTASAAPHSHYTTQRHVTVERARTQTPASFNFIHNPFGEPSPPLFDNNNNNNNNNNKYIYYIASGNRTRVCRVRARYPDQLD